MRRFPGILLLIGILAACSTRSSLEIKEVKIITRDASRLKTWYAENLGLEPSADGERLFLNGFTLLLVENEKARHVDTLKKAYSLEYMPGFYKLGFVTNQFDRMVKTLEENDANLVSGTLYDDDLEMRSVLIKDVDGNLIQLFGDEGRYKLKPYLIGVAVENIGPQEKWYQVNLLPSRVINRDIPDKSIYIRLLKGEDFLIELLNTTDRKIRAEQNYENITGFHKVELNGAKIPFPNDPEGNKLVNP